MGTNLKKIVDMPLPAGLYDRISEVEILLETLNWINREKQRRLVLAQVNLISLELKRIIGGLEARNMASASDIAKIQVLNNNLTIFKNNVINAFSTFTRREVTEVLRERLEKEFSRWNAELTAVLSKLSQKIKKMQLSYN
ncbi:hypothetical protein HYV87_01760 [Candidatus Woesearchaeota archaeon]|nr:hypothetical protein [Candidatus Woesearchaeota archaeon]